MTIFDCKTRGPHKSNDLLSVLLSYFNPFIHRCHGSDETSFGEGAIRAVDEQNRLEVGLETLRDRGKVLLLDCAVRLEADEKREVVVRAVDLVDNLVVETFGDDYAAIIFSAVKGIIENGRVESAKYITGSEMNPGGIFARHISSSSFFHNKCSVYYC